MAGVPIADHLPMLDDELGGLDFVDESRQKQRQIWLSGQKSPKKQCEQRAKSGSLHQTGSARA